MICINGGVMIVLLFGSMGDVQTDMILFFNSLRVRCCAPIDTKCVCGEEKERSLRSGFYQPRPPDEYNVRKQRFAQSQRIGMLRMADPALDGAITSE